jgi:hypothetical protein
VALFFLFFNLIRFIISKVAEKIKAKIKIHKDNLSNNGIIIIKDVPAVLPAN